MGKLPEVTPKQWYKLALPILIALGSIGLGRQCTQEEVDLLEQAGEVLLEEAPNEQTKPTEK